MGQTQSPAIIMSFRAAEPWEGLVIQRSSFDSKSSFPPCMSVIPSSVVCSLPPSSLCHRPFSPSVKPRRLLFNQRWPEQAQLRFVASLTFFAFLLHFVRTSAAGRLLITDYRWEKNIQDVCSARFRFLGVATVSFPFWQSYNYGVKCLVWHANTIIYISPNQTGVITLCKHLLLYLHIYIFCLF